MSKTIQQYEDEAELTTKLAKERKESDESYAIKLVEKIVFTFCGIALVTVVGAILALVIMKK